MAKLSLGSWVAFIRDNAAPPMPQFSTDESARRNKCRRESITTAADLLDCISINAYLGDKGEYSKSFAWFRWLPSRLQYRPTDKTHAPRSDDA